MDFKVQLAKDVGKTVEEALAKCPNAVMEPKYDGWRCIVIREQSGVRVFNRSRKEYTGKLPELEADLAKLPVGTILDGELVAMAFTDEGYINDFYRIHTVMRSNTTSPEQRTGIKLIAFDLIAHPQEGQVISQKPLPVRRALLDKTIQSFSLSLVEMTIQMEATQENHDSLVEVGFEGTVIKNTQAPYAFGKRGHGWFKIKWMTTIDVVITEIHMDGKGQHLGKAGRWTASQYEGGTLVEVAKVNCPDDATRAAMTSDPELFIGRVVEMKHYGPQEDGLRHPTFVRWREDKLATDCILGEC